MKRACSFIALLCFVINANSQTPVLYKKVADLPSYLKLTKPSAFKPGIPMKTIKSGQAVIVNRKAGTSNMLVRLPGAFADGMNPEFAIHASRFVKNPDFRIAILTDEVFPVKQKMVYPIKLNGVYTYHLTAPLNLSQFNNQVLGLGWKAMTNSDGSFYLASTAFKDRLGVQGNEIVMLPETETAKTKWIAYQNGWCSNEKIWLYNPSSRTILGRTINGANVKLSAIKVSDALAYRGTGGADINWDFSGFRTYASDHTDHPSFFEAKSRSSSDRDGDGFVARECGGEDCNDADGSIYPGNAEVCDARSPGKDDDCDLRTFGGRDADGDGYFDASCYNVDATGKIESGGTDCDDNNPAIIPGAMKYISATQVEVCGVGICTVEKGMKAIRQPNGTAIVVPESPPVAKAK